MWVCHWTWLCTIGFWLVIVKCGRDPEPRVQACYHRTIPLHMILCHRFTTGNIKAYHTTWTCTRMSTLLLGMIMKNGKFSTATIKSLMLDMILNKISSTSNTKVYDWTQSQTGGSLLLSVKPKHRFSTASMTASHWTLYWNRGLTLFKNDNESNVQHCKYWSLRLDMILNCMFNVADIQVCCWT